MVESVVRRMIYVLEFVLCYLHMVMAERLCIVYPAE